MVTDRSARGEDPPASPARIWSERLQGALMVGFLAFGAYQGVVALTAPAAQRRLAGVMDGPSMLAGKTAAAINFVQAHYLPADPILRAAGGIFRWRLLGSGGPQVAVGCDDWLYLAEEARPWPDAAAHMNTRADIVGRIATRLAERNIALVVALVPDKARIEEATSCRAPRSMEARARYDGFMGLLASRDIKAVDLATPFTEAHRQGAIYYRTDTHWNQSGAALAAGLIATRVPIELERDVVFRTEAAQEVTDGPGDLLRLMSLDRVPDLPVKLRPSPDRQRLERTIQVEAAGEPAPEAASLLDDGPGGQVVLLGSSYSVNANFHGRLQEKLGLPIENKAEAGGGFAGAARTYLNGTSLAEAPPKLIIWEIPERVVGQPLDAADLELMNKW